MICGDRSSSFFVSNIMTVMGSVMDSFTVSNTMSEAASFAVGFVSPIVILFSLIGTTAAVGFQVTCIRCLNVDIFGITLDTSFSYYAGISAGNVVTVLMLPVFVIIINKLNINREYLWMFPKNFGVPASDEISADITTRKGVVAFSEKAWQFCENKGMPKRIAYLTSLAVEEIGSGMGIRMIMAEASEVRYTTMFNLNNLLIRIKKEVEDIAGK